MAITDLAKLTPSVTAYLKNHPALIEASRDGYMGFDEDGLWVFQGNVEDEMRPYKNPHGTGTSAIVISSNDIHTDGSDFSTAQFPQLQVLIYSDATRGPDNTLVKKDQVTKAFALYGIVDDVFHAVQQQQIDIFGLSILHSKRGFGPRIDAVPNNSGTTRLMVRYDMKLAR